MALASPKQGRVVNGLLLRIGLVARMAGVHPQTIRFLERRGFVPRPRLLADTHHTFGGMDRRYSPLEAWVLVHAARDVGYPLSASAWQWQRAIQARQAYAKVNGITAQEADIWVRHELVRLGLVRWSEDEDEEAGVTPRSWREVSETRSPIAEPIQDRMPGSWMNDAPAEGVTVQAPGTTEPRTYHYSYGAAD
jgi:hypothetical protein